MGRQGKKGVDGVDEHNQTTEPFDFGVSPYAQTVTSDAPAPQMARPGLQPPLIGAYPYLPPSPVRQKGQGDGSSGSAAGNTKSAVSGRRGLRRIFPALVGLCFVVIQLVLLVSFGLKMLKQWDNTLWANVLYIISDVFLWPLQALVHLLPLPFTITAPIMTLLAILLYGVVSRIVVRGLKLFLHARK